MNHEARGSIRGESLARPREWANDGRIPLWDGQGTDLLMRAGSRAKPSEFLEDHAVILTPAESQLISTPTLRSKNHFFMRVGHPRVLAERWEEFYTEVRNVYGFSREDDWTRQRFGFANLCQSFFGSMAVRAHIGWVSLITMQRPQQLRNWEDSRINIRTHEILVGASQLSHESVLLSSGVQQRGSGFCFKHRDDKNVGSLRYVEFHRKISSALLPKDQLLIEWRYVPSIDDDDKQIIKAGRIPSMIPQYSPGEVRLGKNGYLNLAMATLAVNGRCLLLNNTLEIDPGSGRIVTIRAFESTVNAALLASSVVEHVTLCKAIRTLTGSPSE